MYDRHSTAELAPILELIRENSASKELVQSKERVLVNGEPVRPNSLRLRTFAQFGTTCLGCGLEASFFALERSNLKDPYHLNLYGIQDGKEVLFTHDHTLARSLGGQDSIKNSRPVCGPCNWAKGQVEGIVKLAVNHKPITLKQFRHELKQKHKGFKPELVAIASRLVGLDDQLV